MNPFLHNPCPDDIVALYNRQEISWHRFLLDLAGAVERLRPVAGRTGILLTEHAYFGAVGLLAMTQAGVSVIMPPNGQPDSLAALAGSFDVLVCDEGIAAATTASLQRKIVLRHDMVLPLPETPDFNAAARVFFFTSGSSSARKQCEKNLGHLIAEAEAIEHLLTDQAPRHCDVFGTVSHQHAYGFAFRMMWPLLSGRRIISRMYPFIETLFHDLSRSSVLVSSPAHLSRLDGFTSLASAKVPNVLLSAGGRLSDEAAATARQIFGVPVTDIYGSTEAGAMAFRYHNGGADLWQPLPGTTISASAASELRAQAAYIPPEGEYNADRIEMRDHGRFALIGRSDRIVKIEGKRISLSEIERLLGEAGDVREAALVMVDSQKGLGAIVVPTEQGWNTLEQMGHFRFGQYLRNYLGRWIDPAGLPRRWRFLKELPTGDMGKLTQTDLARYFKPGSE